MRSFKVVMLEIHRLNSRLQPKRNRITAIQVKSFNPSASDPHFIAHGWFHIHCF